MRVAILQPSYLPWLGYFDQIAKADVFVFYDDVQYDKNGWRNRNKIKSSQGWQWLTVPIRLNKSSKMPINIVEIDNIHNWRQKHLKSLELNYSRARYFKDYRDYFREVYSRDWNLLAKLNIFLIKGICDFLGIKKQFFLSSELGIGGEKTARLIKICQHFGADEYLTGDAAKDYLQEDDFQTSSIKLEYHHYQHPVYPQLYGEFIPYLSIVDLLFNCGAESLNILWDRHNK